LHWQRKGNEASRQNHAYRPYLQRLYLGPTAEERLLSRTREKGALFSQFCFDEVFYGEVAPQSQSPKHETRCGRKAIYFVVRKSSWAISEPATCPGSCVLHRKSTKIIAGSKSAPLWRCAWALHFFFLQCKANPNEEKGHGFVSETVTV
jgi:hypothetical protein